MQGSSRVAKNDVVLPVGGGDNGKFPVLVTEGTLVIFHLVVLHKRKDLWGPDAEEFRPNRWEGEKASWVSIQLGSYSWRLMHWYRNSYLSGEVRAIVSDVSIILNSLPAVMRRRHGLTLFAEQFALTEASYTAIRLIQEFSNIESRDSQPWTESIGATCSNANGTKVAMMS